MSSVFRNRAFLAAATCVFAASSVFAQDNPNAEVKFRKASQLSAQEQLAQSDKYIAKMKSILVRTQKLAQKARQDKDLIKLNCVNDKLIRIKGNLRLAEGSRKALKLAAARGDAGGRNHEFAKLTITFQKVTVLGQEAEACAGEEISYVGKSRVQVQVDPDVAQQGDPTETPPPPLPVVRPPLASPFL